MLHVAFSMLLYMMALKLRGITGGEDGIGGFPTPPFNIPGIISIDMTNPLNFYYFAVAVLGICSVAHVVYHQDSLWAGYGRHTG